MGRAFQEEGGCRGMRLQSSSNVLGFQLDHLLVSPCVKSGQYLPHSVIAIWMFYEIVNIKFLAQCQAHGKHPM